MDKQILQNATAKLGAAMDKLEFSSLTPEDAESIRDMVADARNSIAILADFEPDTGEFSVLLKTADLIEKAVNAADDSTTYL